MLGRAVVDVEALLPAAARGVALETADGLEETAGRFGAEEAADDVGAVLVRRTEADVPAVADEREAEEAVPVVDNRFDATLAGLLSSLAVSVVERLTLDVVVELAPGRVGGLLMVLLVEVRVAEDEVGFVAVEVRVAAGVREVEDETVEVGRRGGAEAPVFAADAAVPATEDVFL